jgi:hypothetical protein
MVNGPHEEDRVTSTSARARYVQATVRMHADTQKSKALDLYLARVRKAAATR